ncbi:Strubbelig-receptor family [Thalictrum thalictroides]|uniref:Strubbelig-receptor family n=1 Tax=Thalictrum thalictroides TaxID=46969 RepID=A0A7J6UZR4_THATH|nr:Strubbelig-receptor family [Thalictrum thalictroides]
MAKTTTWIPITTLVIFFWLMFSSASATTDDADLSALQDLYRTLSFPPQLTGWKTKGGDPCGELWKGISCDRSSILYIKLNGLDLGGYLGELNLMNLKQLDLSSNHIQGAIPFLLPPNATNMDLSFNNFTGDLPSSFENLTNLTVLYLQNNKFTGSVIFLANLPLIELNIQFNHFSGLIPRQFQYVPNIMMMGNDFEVWTVEYLLQRFRAVVKALYIGGKIVVAIFTIFSIAAHPVLIGFLLRRTALDYEEKRKRLVAVLVFLHGGEVITLLALIIDVHLFAYLAAKLIFTILSAYATHLYVTHLSLRHRSNFYVSGIEFYFAFHPLAHSICAFMSEALETNVLHNPDHFAFATTICAILFYCAMFYQHVDLPVPGLHPCPLCGHTEYHIV